jgi:hypothetical protein
MSTPTNSAQQPPQPSRHLGQPWIWSIGIYAGDSPLHLAPAPGANSPALTARDVADVPSRFVADPFMLRTDGLWHLFFEVMNIANNLGEIGLAVSRDALTWQYRQIVLREPFHLSYPYVFEWNSDFYMLAETLGANAVRLYRAAKFPTEWTAVKDILPGAQADPSIFFFDRKWWLFTCPTPYEHDSLRLYSAADPLSTWTEHPSSPIITGNKRIARPGGRVLILGPRNAPGLRVPGQVDGYPVRFTQDCVPIYGKQVRAFSITELTATTYKEHELPESPVLTPVGGDAWNASGMHHLDAHQIGPDKWIACVDGLKDF